MHAKKIRWTSAALIAVSFCMILASLLSFTIYQKTMTASLLQKAQTELQQSTKQSSLLFNSILENYFNRLNAISLFCGISNQLMGENVMNLLELSNQKGIDYKIGVATKEGLLHTGSNNTADIAHYPFFEQALKGNKTVSSVFPNFEIMDGANSVVLAVPIYIDGEIAGVACAIYNVAAFSGILSEAQYQQGATMIIETDGAIVANYEGLESISSFYDYMQSMEFLPGESPDHLREHIENGQSGFFTFYQQGHAKYLYHEPLGVNDWYILSILPADTVEEQLRTLSTQSFVLMGCNIFFYGVLMMVVLQLIRLRRVEILESQKDSLTLLRNKRSSKILMERYLRRDGKKKMHACFFMDIDNFKHINDSLGHGAGDELLIKFSKKLVTTFRDDDIISRFGGDEFVVWMKNIPSPEMAAMKAETLRGLVLSDNNFPTTISVGITYFPTDGLSYDECLLHADEALYQAKRLGKNRYCFYHDLKKI